MEFSRFGNQVSSVQLAYEDKIPSMLAYNQTTSDFISFSFSFK